MILCMLIHYLGLTVRYILSAIRFYPLLFLGKATLITARRSFVLESEYKYNMALLIMNQCSRQEVERLPRRVPSKCQSSCRIIMHNGSFTTTWVGHPPS